MRYKFFTCLTTVFFIGINQLLAQSAIPNHPTKLQFKPLGWTVPVGTPFRTQLKNGLVAYIAEDHTLPLVQVSLYIRSGSLLEPEGKEGLTSLMASLLRLGGTSKYPADKLNEIIDQYAMNFAFAASESQITLSASFLSEYTDKAFEILEQLLFHPAFDMQKFENERKIMIQNIKHQFDNPGPSLKAAYQKQMYAEEISSRMATEQSVNKITRDDLINLHKKTFHSDKMILSISGNFNRDSILTDLNKIFKDTGSVSSTVNFPDITTKSKMKFLLVHKPMSQAYVRIGLPLFKRPHPDYYAVSLLNEILGGGGFTSRLAEKVRSDAGLTYSIYSNAESNYIYPGTFYIEFFTKNSSFSQAVDMIIKEVKTIITEGVTDKELSSAKASLTGELPSMFRSPFDIVSTYGWNEYYGRDQEHYKLYEEKLNKITIDDIHRVAKQYLVPDNFTYTIVGDSTALINQQFGDFSLSKTDVNTIAVDSIPMLP